MRCWLVMFVALMSVGLVSAGGIQVSQVYGCDIKLTSQEVGRYDLNTWDCEHYVFDKEGITQVINGVSKMVQNFMVVGKSGVVFSMSGYDSNWVWQPIKQDEVLITMQGHVLVGGIDMYVYAKEVEGKTGLVIEYEPKNNSGKNFTDVVYVFSAIVKEKKPMTYYQGGKVMTYNWDKNLLITDKNILKQLAPIIEDEQVYFGYKDLYDHNFVLGVMALGSLRYFYPSLPNDSGYILGFSTFDGKFDNATSVTLDPVIDVNATAKNFQVTTIGWNNNPDWNIFFQQNTGGQATQLYDVNRMPTTNLALSTTGFDWWEWRRAKAPTGYKSENDDATARLLLREDLNSRVQIYTDSGLGATNVDINVVTLNSIYPIGRTETGHGLVRWVVHKEFTDVNISETDYSIVAHALGTVLNDTNFYTDNNVSAPTDAERWRGAEYNKGVADANEVFIVGYPGDYADNRINRFYNAKWNPVAASLWNIPLPAGNTGRRTAWYDNALNPEFNAGEMDYINYVIFLADTNWFTSALLADNALLDENRIDYVLLDWRNPAEPFMQKGTFNILGDAWDENVGLYDLNAAVQLDMNVQVDFNINTKGPHQPDGSWSDMSTQDVNRYRPAFRVNNYTFATQPVVKINSQLGVYDTDYVCDVNSEANAQYAICVIYRDLTRPDQNMQIQIASNFPTEDGEPEPPVAVEELPICMSIRDIDEPATNEGVCVLCEGDANYLK